MGKNYSVDVIKSNKKWKISQSQTTPYILVYSAPASPFFKKTIGEAGLKRKLGPSSRKPCFMNDFLNTHDLR